MEFRCFKCSELITLAPGDSVGRRDSCPKCGTDLRVCRNCRHYDPNSHRECREEIQELIKEKERANFCDSFQPGAGSGAASAESARDEMLKKAAALFGKKS